MRRMTKTVIGPDGIYSYFLCLSSRSEELSCVAADGAAASAATATAALDPRKVDKRRKSKKRWKV